MGIRIYSEKHLDMKKGDSCKGNTCVTVKEKRGRFGLVR